MDGEDAAAGEFEERLNMLKAIGDPIFFRCVLGNKNGTFHVAKESLMSD